MKTFETGEIVECIDARGTTKIDLGGHYVVSGTSWGDTWVDVEQNGEALGGYYNWRFRSTGTFADQPVALRPGDGTPGHPPVNFPGIDGPLDFSTVEDDPDRGAPLTRLEALPDGNPKTRFGVAKPPLSLIPGLARVQVAEAFRDGARKYGPANWRVDPVTTSTYLNAAERHIVSWQDGEEFAADSGVHHLAHAAACLMILLDAQAAGTLQDDRPTPAATSGLIRDLTKPLAA